MRSFVVVSVIVVVAAAAAAAAAADDDDDDAIAEVALLELVAGKQVHKNIRETFIISSSTYSNWSLPSSFLSLLPLSVCLKPSLC